MADYGFDVSTFPDLDVTGRTITGSRAVAECVLRRLTTPAGSIPYDPDFGHDIRYLLNEDLSPREVKRHEARIAMEIEKDERISGAEVSVTLEPATMTLKIHAVGSLVDADSFDFVLAIDTVSAEILRAT